MQEAETIGILAYGSLIDDPGSEIEPLIVDRIQCVTPFNIEYARISKSRDNGPTLIPITDGGAKVNAVILVLKANTPLEEAENMLWRRETRKVGTGKNYKKKETPGKNGVQIATLSGFEGIDKVIYTSIRSNLGINTPAILAKFAVESILSEAGEKKLDGVRYFLAAKSHGVITPLSEEYEKDILTIAGAPTLEQAIAKLDEERPLHLKKKSN